MIATIEPIPAFTDNYLWLIHMGSDAVVVDPGDGDAVLTVLEARGLTLCGILVTHHHPDHVGGIPRLLSHHSVPVYGPRAEAPQIPTLSHLLDDGDSLRIPEVDLDLEVLAVPGHTLGHIAYRGAISAEHSGTGSLRRVLFCGDTLFASGCGRLFEGTPADMHGSLSRLAALPEDTEVFCAHEYTTGNLQFAEVADSGNDAVREELARVRAVRSAGLPSLPSSIGRERRTNPFLRCGEAALAHSAATHAGSALGDPIAVFAALRRWKDSFRPPMV